jgi:HNH endonuclease
MRQTLEQRFWKNVYQTTNCWFWVGAIANHGYGEMHVAGSVVLAHRLSYELNVGEVPPEMHVLHKCDTRQCVRPDHLYVGTHTEI